MPLRGRRLLLAAGLTLLVATPGHAAEICVGGVCQDPAFVGDTLAAYGVDTGVGTGGGGGNGGEGVICQYIKYTPGAPQGWNGGYGPPYVFSRTYAWGETYPDPEHWQFRDCGLACVTASTLMADVCVTPPGTRS